MKRSRILFSLLRIPLDILTLSASFLIARNIRAITDGIPGIYLPRYSLAYSDLFFYILLAIIIFLIIQESRNMYRLETRADASSEITQFLGNTFLWFLIFIGAVYLSMGFSDIQDLPRLIIFFATILFLIFGSLGRMLLVYGEKRGIEKNIFPREQLLVIGNSVPELEENPLFHIVKLGINDPKILDMIRSHAIDTIFFSGEVEKGVHMTEIIELAKVYGIRTIQTIIPGEFSNIPREIIEWNGIAVVNFSAITITPWERLLKRIFDIFLSIFLLILFFPLFLIIGICIKIEDPSGPIIFRNRRVGLDGTIFTLYKFRYMYWKYSVKDAYGKSPEDDPALQYEMELREKQSSRKGPLYKVENDPRVTKIGKIIEKFSIDELPQLWNVFIGNMSFIGPRAHQPREVEQYEEYQNQVLTVKPGITGMAQVHGRDQNSFEDEVKLDIYYIEHYSLWLDSVIFFRTLFVVLRRGLTGR